MKSSADIADREGDDYAVRRWVTLAASTIPAMCCGFYYAWSVLVIPMMEMHGWTSADVSLAFTLVVAVPGLMALLAGKLLQYIQPPTLLLLSGGILGLGTVLLSFADSLPLLYLFALIAGLGGMTYPGSTMSNLMRFFPDRRGMASGVLTGGFGLGAVIWGPVTVLLLGLIGFQWSLRLLGALFIVVIAVCSRLITVAPTDYAPRRRPAATTQTTSPQTSGQHVTVDTAVSRLAAETAGEQRAVPQDAAPDVAVGLSWKAMVRTPAFWSLALVFMLGLVSGLMVTGHASPIAQQMLGISPEAAGAFVSYLALGMAVGKVGLGTLSDRVGRLPVLLTVLILAIAALLLLWQAGGYLAVVAGVFVVGLCYGGFLALIGPMTLDTFGPRHFAINFGIMYLAVGVASYVGPRLAAAVAEASDGIYKQAFLLAAILTVVGLALAVAYGRLRRRVGKAGPTRAL